MPSSDDARTQPVELGVGPEGLLEALVARISRASAEILVMAYELEHDGLVAALAAAHGRRVLVRVLVDSRQPASEAATATLDAAGVAVRAAPCRFTHAHAKVLLCDRAEVVIMSANFNEFSMETERNYLAIDRDPRDIADVRAVFEGDWAGDPDVDARVPEETRLVVSPVNARRRIEDLIRGARERLDLAVMSLLDPSVVEAVVSQRRRGVPVRVLLADPEWIGRNLGTASALVARGVGVRFLCDLELHAKLVIADGRVLVGSHNLSPTSLDENREIGLVVDEPAAVGLAQATFEDDWSRGVIATD